MTRQFFTRTASLAAVVASLAATPAVAQQDLRSPDTRDQSQPRPGLLLHRSGYAVSTPVDPHGAPGATAKDSASIPASAGTPAPVVRTDLRSPDARDAANHISTASVQAVPLDSVDGSDFQWGDAGIGAGVIAGLVLLFGLTAVAVRHRHHSLPTA